MSLRLGTTLAEASKKDKPWTVHKDENASVGALYAAEPRFIKYADRMADCGKRLEFANVIPANDAQEHDRKLKLTNAHFCRVRHCPICAWRKSLALKARFLSNLPAYLEANPKWVYVYAVLTVRNPPMAELRSTIQGMNKALKKMMKRAELVRQVKGYIKTVEVTRGKDGNPHPHFNLIIALPSSYFMGDRYLSQKRWAALWQDCLGVGYEPIVHVKKIRVNKRKMAEFECSEAAAMLISGVLEVVKYSVKPEDVIEDPAFLYGVTDQLNGMRLFEQCLCMKDLFKKNGKRGEEEADDSAEPGDDELMLKDSSSVKIGDRRFVFVWESIDYYLRKKYTQRE